MVSLESGDFSFFVIRFCNRYEHSETAYCGLLAMYFRYRDIRDFKTPEYCSGQRFGILLDNFCNILHANSRMAKSFLYIFFPLFLPQPNVWRNIVNE